MLKLVAIIIFAFLIACVIVLIGFMPDAALLLVMGIVFLLMILIAIVAE